MLLVGSAAISWMYNREIIDFNLNRKPVDYDVWCTKEQFKKMVKDHQNAGWSIFELKINGSKGHFKATLSFDKTITETIIETIIEADFLDVEGQFTESNNAIYDFEIKVGSKYRTISINKCTDAIQIAHPYTVLMLKESHKYKRNSPHFLKTMQDINTFKIEGYSRNDFSDEQKELLAQREKATYNYSHPNLMQKKDTFFTDEVPYLYDHDTIHEAVKHLDKPAYQYYMRDGEQVMCDKDKFNKLDKIVKLYGVLEESYVLALERSVIPFNSSPRKAFEMALMKVCTSITSGWFREFAYDNYFEVLNMYHGSYVEKFNKALSLDQIAPFKVAQY